MINNVSVVIPSYNSANFLPEAIESVLGQTYSPFEVIVVDDGSTDETKQVCDRYPTVRYIYQTNQGVAAARNTGMQVSQGEYLLFLDSDDCLLPEAIEIGVNCINAHPKVGFVFGRYFFYSIQPDGSYKVEETYEDQPEVATYETLLATRHKIQCGCVIFRRTAIESVVIQSIGAFDPSLVPMEDINLFLRIARNFPVHFHSQVVSKYRYTGNNLSSKSAKMLIIARHSHSLQWSYIQETGNKNYEAAYRQGERAWTKLFIDRLPYEIIRHVQAGQWVAALGILRLILHYDPKLKCINKDIYDASFKTLLAELRKLPIQDSLVYWKQQLAGAPPLLSLPTDRPRPAEQSFGGQSQSFLISQKLTAALDLLSKQAGVTLSTTLLAAFDVLLYRHAGTEDIIVGSPLVSRIGSENFVNAVPLRTDLSGHPKFQELLGRVQKVASLAQTHQSAPYCLLVDELCPQQDSSYAPLFQVTFVFEENVPLQAVELSRTTASPWVIENNEGKFDLTLFLKPTTNGLEGIWSYNTDLFDAETIERMNGHFQTLLEGIVTQPDRAISELPLLTAKEKQQLLVEWNGTQTNYPHDKCIHQLVAEQADRTPEAIAVAFEDQAITYKALNERANQLAHYLQKAGVQPDGLVGICVERSLEMVVGLIGILKAGAAYVPIDPNFPSDRVDYMLDNAQVKLLLTQQRLVEKLPTQGASVICLDADWHDIAQESQETPSSSVTPDNIAYVIYTSGSTGKPKGVQVLHRGVVNFLDSMKQQPGISPDDRLLSVTTLSFDIAVLELFLPLIVGARVVLLSREAAMDGRKLARTISNLGITVMQATPATWRLLLEAGWEGNQTMKVLSGGEAISRELAAELLAKSGELWNLYGPTETTIWSTVYKVGLNERRISIGKPIANTEIYILDALLQPVPIGVAGELHIGGAGLAKGYLKRPDLTAEKFIPNPFCETGASRIYKTGDLARYLPDGSIECLGRLDFQVKIRGFRIELGEIESVLVEHPAVQQAVVIVREDAPGDKRLVGYIVALNNQSPSTSELRSLVRANVPEYMVPSIFVFLDVLPLTPNGKVDRKALPVPDQTRQEVISPIGKKVSGPSSETVHETSIAPQDDLDLQLLKIWENVLNISPINMEDNFFELGGHSLLAVALITEIEKTYKKELPLSILFQAPTVQQLANTLRKEGCSSSSQTLVTIQKGDSKTPLFCIYGIFLYYELAKHLGTDQTVYGVYLEEELHAAQGEKSDQSSMNLVSITELATRYLKEIRAQQPVGPYFFAGESLGGLVAFEMAQQLHLQGEKVALLGLFDSAIPGKNKLSFTQLLHLHARKILRQGIPYIRKRMQKGIHPAAAPVSDVGVRVSDVEAQTIFRDYAFNSYTPQPYSGEAVLFRAIDENHFSTLKAWKSLAVGGLEIHDISGDHLGILQEPNVQLLAKKMRACMDQALARL